MQYPPTYWRRALEEEFRRRRESGFQHPDVPHLLVAHAYDDELMAVADRAQRESLDELTEEMRTAGARWRAGQGRRAARVAVAVRMAQAEQQQALQAARARLGLAPWLRDREGDPAA